MQFRSHLAVELLCASGRPLAAAIIGRQAHAPLACTSLFRIGGGNGSGVAKATARAASMSSQSSFIVCPRFCGQLLDSHPERLDFGARFPGLPSVGVLGAGEAPVERRNVSCAMFY